MGRAAGAVRVFRLDNPTIAICPAASDTGFHAKMTALDEASNDFLDALPGHVAFGGEVRDAGPCASLLFVDEVREDKGQHESKRRQIRVGAHLVEPREFFTRESASYGGPPLQGPEGWQARVMLGHDVESSAITCWQNGGSVVDPKQPKLILPLFRYSQRQRQARGGVFESLRSARDEIAFRIRGIAFGGEPQ